MEGSCSVRGVLNNGLCLVDFTISTFGSNLR
jgi:hypothetical protein